MKLRIFGVCFIISVCFYYFIYSKYNKKEDNYTKVYLLQVGAYENYDNVVNVSKDYENYIVIKEDNLYKLLIGVTESEEVFDKFVKLYIKENKDYLKRDIKLTNKELEKNINKYDIVIKNTENIKEINLVVKEGLKEIKDFINKNDYKDK